MEGCKHGELFDVVKSQFTNGTLAQYCKDCENPNIAQKPLSRNNQWLDIVRDIFRQLVNSVSWMHENGVCHLDLSLENTCIIT